MPEATEYLLQDRSNRDSKLSFKLAAKTLTVDDLRQWLTEKDVVPPLVSAVAWILPIEFGRREVMEKASPASSTKGVADESPQQSRPSITSSLRKRVGLMGAAKPEASIKKKT